MTLGRVEAVEEQYSGTELTSQSAIGATIHFVEDTSWCSDFGGTVVIGTETLTYDTFDEELDTIHTTTGPVAAWPAETEVRPPDAERSVNRYAELFIQGQEDEDGAENAVARVPEWMFDRLDLGTRQALQGEWVIIEEREGELWVVDFPGENLAVNVGDYGENIPPNPTDGSPPLTSPTPVIINGLGVMHARWSAITNADAVSYDVHVSASSGFTPGPSNLVATTDATAITIKTLQDGSPLVYGTPYYVKIVARDADGSGPASSEAGGTVVQINSPDIVAGSIISDLLAANSVTADKLSAVLILAGAIKTAEGGQRVEIDAQGIRLIAQDESVMVDLPTQSGEDATFNGQILAAALEVLGASTHRGIGTLVPGAAWVLSLSVPNPITGPTLSMQYDSVNFQDGTRSRSGLAWDSSSSRWWTGRNFVSGGHEVCELRSYDASGNVDTLIPQSQMPTGAILCAGAVRVGTRVYALLHIYNTFPIIEDVWQIHSFDATTGAYINEATSSFTPTTLMQSSSGIPALGYDGTNLIVVGVNSSGFLQFHKFTSTVDAPVFVSTTTSTGLSFSITLPLNLRGFASAESAWWVSVRDTTIPSAVFKYTTAGANVANSDFPTLGGSEIFGVGHDGTQFWTLDQSGQRIVKHTNWVWTTESPVYWVGYTWYNNGSGAETLVSPRASITMKRRAKLRIGNPGIQAGADRVRVYANRGASEPTGGAPTRFSGYLQLTDALTTRDATSIDFTGTPPENPGANGFGASTPAELRSSGGEPLMRANGIPRCRLVYNAGGSLTTSVLTYIRFGTEEVDTDGFHQATTDALSAAPGAGTPYELLMPFTGQYLFILRANFAAGTGQRHFFWDINGAGGETHTEAVTAGATAHRSEFVFIVNATAGDVVRVGVLQSSGAGLVLTSAGLYVEYKGPA